MNQMKNAREETTGVFGNVFTDESGCDMMILDNIFCYAGGELWLRKVTIVKKAF